MSEGLIPLPERSRNWRETGMRGLVTGLFLLVCAGTGVVQILLPVEIPEVIGREKAVEDAIRSRARFVDGTLARLWQHRIDLRCRIKQSVQPLWAATLYGLFGEAMDVAVVGSDGWLYMKARLQYARGGSDELVDPPAQALAALSRRLAAKGCDLHILLVPGKATVYPDHLPIRSELRAERYSALVAALRSHEVSVIDLLKIYREHPDQQVYFRTDSHWSTRGIALASEAVARRSGTWIPEPQRSSVLAWLARVPDAGDCLRYIGIDVRNVIQGGFSRTLMDLGSRYREIDHMVVGDLARTTLIPYSPRPDAPVLLTGTSYSLPERIGPFLDHFSGHRIRVVAAPGRGPFAALNEFFIDGWPDPGPRAVCMEIPAFGFFTESTPLLGLGDILASLPASRLTPVTAPNSQPPSLEGTLQPGTHPLGTAALSARFPGPHIENPGAGILSVTLRGKLRGTTASIRIQRGNAGLTATWKPTMTKLTIPVIGGHLNDPVEIRLTSPKAGGQLELEVIGLVWELPPTY